MKILILFKKKAGGVGSVIPAITKELEKMGHTVKSISREDDLKIYSLLGSIFPLRRKIGKLVKEENFEVVYTQDWSLAFPFLFPIRKFGKKLFCVFYGSDNYFSKLVQTLVGKLMRKNLVVCNDELKKRFPRAHLIYNRVDHNFFNPSTKTKVIKESVGFSNWKTEEYSFGEVKNAVEKLGKKFIVTNNVPKEEMPNFYRQLESFVSLPPSYAGFGLVYLEAMASGVKKIIGSNYGGGEILPITKIEDYGGNIAEAIKNAESKDYRKWVLENKFTWEDAVKELENIFICGGKE